MNDEDAIRQRIQAFLADALAWSERNSLVPVGKIDLARLEAAEKEKKSLANVHGVHVHSLDSVMLSHPPEHSPHTESIQAIHWHPPESAVVETCDATHPIRPGFEYEMAKIGGEWRIKDLRQIFGDSTMPPSDARILDTLRQSPRASLLFTELPEGLERLFEGPCLLGTRRGEIRTEVSTLDVELPVPSGWIACDDPGYWYHGASTFEIPIPPGSYPLQIAHDGREITAARLLVQPSAKAVRYCKATRHMAEDPPSQFPDRADSNCIGVDTGRIGLADAESLYGMSWHAREKMDALACKELESSEWQRTTMSNGIQGINFGTGGDGGFIAYWALDSQDHPVALYFDVPNLAHVSRDECVIPIRSDNQTSFEHPMLTKAGINVRWDCAGENEPRPCLVITPRDCWAEFAVSDFKRTIIIQFEQGFGSGSSEEGRFFYFPDDFHFPVGGLLHLRWDAGHSYRFLPPVPQTSANTPEAFGALWKCCGCDNEGAPFVERIKMHYEECPPGRHYHNWRHLTECLVELNSAKPHFPACDLNAVEMALWFHDVVYEPRARDNEEQSAQAATQLLNAGNAPQNLIDKVSALIVATKTHPSEADPDTALVLDIDLSILGQPSARYQAYEEAIRSEYSWVPFAIFAHERRKILSRFLERKCIYLTAYFRDRCEAQARHNLQEALTALPALPDSPGLEN